MSKLLIIENISPKLIKFVKSKHNDADLLLLTPEAVFAFKGSGFKIHYPEDYVKSEQLNKIGMENFERTRKFVSIVDEYLKGRFSFIKEEDFHFAFYHSDRFKIFMDSVISRIIILNNAVNELKPHKIYYAKETSEDYRETAFANEAVYSLLIPFITAKFSISAEPYPFIVPYRNFSKLGIKLRYFTKIYTILTALFKKMKQYCEHSPNRKDKILAINPKYDLNEILNMPQVLQNFEIWKWSKLKTDSLRRSLFISLPYITCMNTGKTRNINLKGMESKKFNWNSSDFSFVMERIKPLCDYNGINFLPLLEKRLKFFLNTMVAESFNLYLQIKAILRHLLPEIVLYNSGVSNIQEGIIIKAIKDCGIPPLMVQHGGGAYGLLFGPNIFVRDFEQIPDSSLIAWGDGVKNYFSDYSKKYNVNIIPAGSSIIRNIYKQNDIKRTENKNLVYYICTDFRRNRTYYPMGLHYTDSWYFRLHLKIFEIFNKYKSYKFVFKLPPGFKGYDIYKDMAGAASHIQIDDEPLLSIIYRPGLYIIDSLSTAIIQAVATRIPIIVYTGEHCKKPNADALVSLQRRAICCDTAEDFCNTIDNFLGGIKQYYADVYDEEFIRLYGIGGASDEPHWEIILRNIAKTKCKIPRVSSQDSQEYSGVIERNNYIKLRR